jgi:hypothetical protein
LPNVVGDLPDELREAVDREHWPARVFTFPPGCFWPLRFAAKRYVACLVPPVVPVVRPRISNVVANLLNELSGVRFLRLTRAIVVLQR